MIEMRWYTELATDPETNQVRVARKWLQYRTLYKVVRVDQGFDVESGKALPERLSLVQEPSQWEDVEDFAVPIKRLVTEPGGTT